MAGRCFFLIAVAMLISALEFVGVSWTDEGFVDETSHETSCHRIAFAFSVLLFQGVYTDQREVK